MVIKILLIIAILVQSVATVYALKLVRATKYKAIWVLFIIGFSILSVERMVQYLILEGLPIPRYFLADLGIIVSICLSIGVMYTHKLFKYIDRLNLQRQLWNRRILTAVLRTEEKARSNFSKELHDGLGPLLSSAKMSLTTLVREEQDPARRELLGNTTYIIDEAIRSIREISNNLSPHVLNDFGLARGIQNFIDKSVAIHRVKIRFTTNLNRERFETDVEVILYRVICELIHNSLKHAACHTITLALTHTPEALHLEYADDGRGFKAEVMSDLGMGLSNIASRIGSLGGSSQITSKEGCGMQAVVTIPFEVESQPKPARKGIRKRKERL
ncbi:MAG: sensor histidine kinase [Alistipes sp.]|nr:sensor histidine kinase [Alistipes sp.]